MSSIRLCTAGLYLLLTASLACAEGWQAGVAQTSILPAKAMWMSGYASRDHVAEGTQTELSAKALVLQDPAGLRVVIITLDLIGIDHAVGDTIRAGVAKLGIPPERCAICTSHTHSGPVVGLNLESMFRALDEEQKEQVVEYTQATTSQIVETVEVAIADIRPATISHGLGRATFAVNRRNNPEAEVPTLREKGELRGPSDHDVPVLAVRSGDDLRAVLFGYACHATVLSGYFWNADYPGYAQAAIEEVHPETIALFWAGCGGDQNPLPRRTVELAQQYGAELAKSVEAVLAGNMTPLNGAIAATAGTTDLKFAHVPTPEELGAAAKSENKYEAARALALLDQLAKKGAVAPAYPYPIQAWKLGDGPLWVLLGGEVVVDYALRIKMESPGTTWVAAYSNDVMAYIPSLRVLKEGGYEGGGSMVYYGLPSAWNEEVEDTIIKEVHRQRAAVGR